MSKNLIKFIALFIIIVTLIFVFHNYHSVYNIDHLAYAVALGLDVGENNKIKLSFQLSIPGGESGNSGSSQSDSTVVNSVECSTINSGINLLNTYISKEVNLSHCKVIVFSEKFAYQGLGDSIYTLMNNVQIRPDCNIIISKCNAEYFLNTSKPVLEKLSARYYEVAPSSSDYSGYTEDITLSEFFSDLNDTTSQCYGILGGVNTSSTHSIDDNSTPIQKDTNIKADDTLITSKPNIENMGLAIFKNDKLVGELTGFETVCHQIITNNLNSCSISIHSPFEENKIITLRVNLKDKTKNSVELTDNGPYISSKISLEARVLSASEASNYLSAENVKELEKYINSYMKEQISSYLYKISKEYNSDIDGFGRYATKNFLTWNDWINYNWLENFNSAFFNVEVDTTIKSSYILS